MNGSIEVDLDDNRIIWIFNREDYERNLSTQLVNALNQLRGQPYVFLIDLRSLRYRLPLDRIMILHVIEKASSYNLIELVYLVNSSHYTRMHVDILVNELPFKEIVFKYEANAREYLDTIVRKHKQEVSMLSM